MYVIFTYIYHKHQPNVGKYTIHGLYGICKCMSLLTPCLFWHVGIQAVVHLLLSSCFWKSQRFAAIQFWYSRCHGMPEHLVIISNGWFYKNVFSCLKGSWCIIPKTSFAIWWNFLLPLWIFYNSYLLRISAKFRGESLSRIHWDSRWSWFPGFPGASVCQPCAPEHCLLFGIRPPWHPRGGGV